MNEMMIRLTGVAGFLRDWCPEAPELALVLGSGFGVLSEDVVDGQTVEYRSIPGFPCCTNPMHPGRLTVGTLWGTRVALLHGRIHCYEGYRADEVVVPVRSLALWGVQTFVLTNAAGAINPAYQMGQFMAITDHLNLLGQNPLSGRNIDELGTRFPDMGSLYDRSLVKEARATADEAGVVLHQGVYAAMPGPSYETPAEIRMLRTLGADAVGMSTVPEALALAHMGRRVFGLSCLTNLAAGLGHEALSDSDIVRVLDRPEAQRDLRVILAGVLNAAR